MFKWLRKYLSVAIGESMATVTGYRRPLGYQQLGTAALTAGAINIVFPTPVPGVVPGYAILQCQGGSVRWRDDGVDPTATVGMTIPANGELDYCGDLSKIKLILASGSPIVDVSIYA